MIVDMLYTSLTLGEEPLAFLASLRETSSVVLSQGGWLFGLSSTGLPALHFFRERCTMFTIIAAVAIFAALTGGVVAAIRRSHSQACIIDARLRTYCAR